MLTVGDFMTLPSNHPELKTNWAGNYEYGTTRVSLPETIEQIQALVAHSQKLRVLGTRHSFNGIADSDQHLISLERFPRFVEIDSQRHQASAAGNITYGELCRQLHHAGFALHNLASLPHISVVGACATATHGSGVENRTLAAAVSALEMVTATGDLVSLSRGQIGDQFEGVVVNLGGLGVVTRLQLDLLPAFDMRQEVYEHLPLSKLEEHFDEIVSSAYSVSLFTDWREDDIAQVWLKKRLVDGDTDTPPDFFGATLARKPLHPIAQLSAEPCTEQMGIPGPWHERLPHFRYEATPSAGNELQSEYFLPRHHTSAALRAVRSLKDKIAPHLWVSEIRSIAADDFWMSPFYRRDSVAIHFTWKPDWSAVRDLLPLIEALLAPFDARPHWGKLFTLSPQHLHTLYEKLPDFQQLLRHYDPQMKFRNTFLHTNLFVA
jgi:xylitol oxidase